MKSAGVIIYKFVKKRDIFIGAIILFLALVIAITFWIMPFEGQLYACIYIDGEFIESVPLENEINQVDIKTQYGTNILVMIDEKAFIKESDCGYEQCIKKGAISRPFQVIVCAPHSLIIKIEDEQSVRDK